MLFGTNLGKVLSKPVEFTLPFENCFVVSVHMAVSGKKTNGSNKLIRKFSERIGWIFIGISTLGAFLDSLSNAITFFSFKVAIWVTAILFFTYVSFLAFFKLKRKRAVDNEPAGEKSGFRQRVVWYMIGVICLVWVPVFFNDTRQSNDDKRSTGKLSAFLSTDKRFKVLILPFKKECEYQNASYDIGHVISKRLTKLNAEDSLNLGIHYLVDTVDYAAITSAYIDTLTTYHNADLIIYGYYSFRGCEDGKADKICFNYGVNKSRWWFGNKQFDSLYKMTSFAGLDKIRNGYAQQPLDYIIYFSAGLSAEKEERFSKAIDYYKKIDNYATDSTLLLCIAWCNLRAGNLNDAYDLYDKVLRLDPANGNALSNLGTVLLAHDVNKAKSHFERAIKIHPQSAGLKNSLGLAYSFLKNDLEAKKYYEAALQIDEKYFPALSNLASVNFKLGDYESCIRCYRMLERYAGLNSVQAFELGSALINTDNIPAAHKYLLLSYHASPRYAATLSLLGYTYYAIGRSDSALYFHLQANAIDSTIYNTLSNLPILYLEKRDYDNVIKFSKKSIALNPADIDSWNLMGLAYMNKGAYASAESCFKTVLKIDSTYSEARKNMNSLEYLKQHR